MPADEVCEDEEGHSLSDLGIVGVPGVRSADGAVHLEVAAHEDGEGDAVGEHEEDDVAEAEAVVRLEGQAHRELAVVGHADEGQDGLRDGEGNGGWLGGIHLLRSQNFQDFGPPPPLVRFFG